MILKMKSYITDLVNKIDCDNLFYCIDYDFLCYRSVKLVCIFYWSAGVKSSRPFALGD